MTVSERVLDYLRGGWGSRCSVFRALLDEFGVKLEEKTIKLICLALDPFHAPSASFYVDGKKFGITVCGALSGALSAFNLIVGSPDLLPYEFWTEGMKEGGWIKRMLDEGLPLDEKLKTYIKMCERYGYGAHYEMVRRFYKRFGTTDCYELSKDFDFVSRDCFKNCAKVVIWTAEMAASVIREFKANPDAFKIGKENVLYRFMSHGS